MRRVVTSRDDGAELDEHSSKFQSSGKFPYPTSSHQSVREPAVKWSNYDAHVACLADSVRSQQFKLPWESGYAGMVLSNKFPKLVTAIGDEPMNIGRAEFIRASTASSTSVSHVALIPKLPGHVRRLKLMKWHVDADDLRRI